MHGYGGKHEEHWQSYLNNALKDKSRSIIYPDFPNPDRPKLNEWLMFLDEKLKGLDPASLVVAGHSLGCSLWLHYIAKHKNIIPKKVFLVSPPLNDCGVIEIANFFPLPDLDLNKQDYLIIGSDNDNFILEKEFEILAKNLKIPLKILHNAGHINAPVHGYWNWMNEECLKLI